MAGAQGVVGDGVQVVDMEREVGQVGACVRDERRGQVDERGEALGVLPRAAAGVQHKRDDGGEVLGVAIVLAAVGLDGVAHDEGRVVEGAPDGEAAAAGVLLVDPDDVGGWSRRGTSKSRSV